MCVKCSVLALWRVFFQKIDSLQIVIQLSRSFYNAQNHVRDTFITLCSPVIPRGKSCPLGWEMVRSQAPGSLAGHRPLKRWQHLTGLARLSWEPRQSPEAEDQNDAKGMALS